MSHNILSISRMYVANIACVYSHFPVSHTNNTFSSYFNMPTLFLQTLNDNQPLLHYADLSHDKTKQFVFERNILLYIAIKLTCAPCLQIAVHFNGDDKEAFREVIQRIYIPKKTTWRDIAHLCKRAGYDDHSTALLDAYNTGLITVFPFNYLNLLFILLQPVQLDELSESLRLPPILPPLLFLHVVHLMIMMIFHPSYLHL